MSGCDQQKMFSYLSPESRVPQYHPLRPIRIIVDKALKELSPELQEFYSRKSRPAIAQERLLRSLLLQILYSIWSNRMLVEQLDYNLLFRLFVGLSMDEETWNHFVYSKNRDRILNTEFVILFLRSICEQAENAGLLLSDHFTVDGTLIEPWDSLKSFRKNDEGSQPPLGS